MRVNELRTSRWLAGAASGAALVVMAAVPASAQSNQDRPGPTAAHPFGDRVIHTPAPLGAPLPVVHPGDRVEVDGSCSANPAGDEFGDEKLFASVSFSRVRCGDSTQTYPKWVGLIKPDAAPGKYEVMEVVDGPPWPKAVPDPVHILVPGSGEVHAGDPVEFDGTCQASSEDENAGPLTSLAVGTLAWQRIGEGVGRSEGWRNPVWLGYVKSTIAPGTYPVSFRCPGNGETVTGSVRVVGPQQPKPQIPVKPKGAPQTGGGGMSSVVSQWG